jgi:phospholipid transport system substrate-binding protein
MSIRQRSRTFVLVAGAVLVASGARGPAHARAAGDTPGDVIRDTNARVAAILRPGREPTAAERAQVFAVIERVTDFAAVARAAIGPRWADVPAAQQREFVDAFGRLVSFAAIDKMGQYRADRVAYLGEDVTGDRAVVHTLAEYKDRHVPVDYLLARTGGVWKVVDYRLAGVLTTANYRKQFDRALKHGSFADLLARIRQKLAELGGRPPRPR